MSEIVRSYSEPVETLIVQRGDIATRKVRGVASVYYNGQPGTQYDLTDNIIERIAPGAFDTLLNEDCIACVNHDGKLIVGRNKANLKLWTSPRGLEYEVDLPNTTAANDLWENTTRGIIRGSSFRAGIDYKKDAVWSREGDKNVVTIKRFNMLKDVSCVSDPAYRAADCAAVVRSLEAHQLQEETLKRIAIAQNLKF